MSAAGAGARLQDAEKLLRGYWADVCAHWRDEQARAFEEEIIQPFLGQIRTVERAVAELSVTLQQVRRDCE
jgi:hypothetical protein